MKAHYGKLVLSFVIFTISTFTANAQTLKETFDGMIEKSNSWEQYKVIKITEINDFWKQTADTLSQKTSSIVRYKSEVSTLKSEIEELKGQLSSVQSKLDTSQELNDTIVFLGMNMEKTGYHVMMWAIVIILIVIVVVVYFMYMRSNSVTSKLKKEYSQLAKEFEAHKDKSREMQVKLKRDLQTAVNSLEDLKRGGSARR